MGIKKLKLAVFISGRGSNLQAIVNACKSIDYPAEISVVLSNRPDARGLLIAQTENIPTEVVDHTLFDSREAFEDAIHHSLSNHSVDLIVLAGFMRILSASFVTRWPRKIINIHPSLLPDYKGQNTHARAIADGKKQSGCTVHYVIPEMDSGEIILQKTVPVISGDTPETLSDRILEQEHLAYPEAIKIIASQR